MIAFKNGKVPLITPLTFSSGHKAKVGLHHLMRAYSVHPFLTPYSVTSLWWLEIGHGGRFLHCGYMYVDVTPRGPLQN